jgi:hypothetical protein
MANQKISARTILTSAAGLLSIPIVRAAVSTSFRWTNNFFATTNPTATDDSAAGYHVFSLWFNTTSGRLWVCRDSTASAAKWRPIGNGLPGTRYVSGRYYVANWFSSNANNAPTANRIYLYPFMVDDYVTINDWVVRCAVGVASSALQGCVYGSDPATNLPTGNPLQTSGAVNTTANHTSHTLSTGTLTPSTLLLEPGKVYWFGGNMNIAATLVGASQTTPEVMRLVGWATLADVYNNSGTTTVAGIYYSQTYGTWPDLTGVSPTFHSGGWSPIPMFKVA